MASTAKKQHTAEPKNKGDVVVFEIEKARKAGYNILAPTVTHEIGGVNEFYKPIIDRVQLSTNPDDKDIYPDNQKKGSFRISGQGLAKLSVCAGIQYFPALSGRCDDRSDRDYIAYRCVGGIRKADGEYVCVQAEYDIDFEVLEEELKDQHAAAAKKYNKGQEYIDYCVRRDMLFKRKHKRKLCETGAQNRVIRKLLGVKSSYTLAELQKPFVMVRMSFQPDMSDPEVKRQFLAIKMQGVNGIYGQNVLPQSPVIDIDPADVRHVEDDAPDEPDATIDPDMPPDEPPANTAEPSPEDVFASYSDDEQVSVIEGLMDRKGYDRDSLKKPVTEFTASNRMKFFLHLSTMPDAEPSDIPF